ncbi:MAG: biotin--[acetyl-CoA-carboxylase] ligase [Pseudomonadota bacterium]
MRLPPISWHDTLDSTNARAKDLAKAGTVTDIWIAARQQTAGRGRLGRSWISPEGNLFATALISVPGGVDHAMRLPFAAALAVHDVLAVAAPSADFRLKWPNDVRCNAAKISGILVETGAGNSGDWAAVGIGINIASAPDGAAQEAACLAEYLNGPAPTPEELLPDLVNAFQARKMEAWRDFAATRKDWCDRAEALNQQVRVRIGARDLEGCFAGLSDDGGLILEGAEGAQEIVRAGDVQLVSRA